MINRLMSLSGPLIVLGSCLASVYFLLVPTAGPLAFLMPVVLLLLGGLALGRCWGRSWLLACVGGAAIFVQASSGPIWSGYFRSPTEAETPGGSMPVETPLRAPDPLRRRGVPKGKTLRLAPGLSIAVFAAGLEGPRMLAFSPAGDLYVSLPRAGRVVVLPDRNGDAAADEVRTFAEGLDRPHGLAFAGKDLVAAENGRLVRLPDRDGNLTADQVEELSKDLPAGGGHWTRSVAFGPTGDFFVAAGSSCNVCIEKDPRRAAILRIGPEGGEAEIFARGLRNSVGLAFHPETGELWASNNGRDWLGDDLPPEEVNRIVAGGDYGWPYCYGQRIPDPDFGSPDRCRNTRPPEVEMPAHSAPLGIAFGHGLAFPDRYRSMLYVAFHGSWNRSVPTGYKLVGIPFRDGRPSGPPEDIVSGWLHGRSAWGRPVSPAVGPDGALYLSDDRAGIIYRISAADRTSGRHIDPRPFPVKTASSEKTLRRTWSRPLPFILRHPFREHLRRPTLRATAPSARARRS